MRFFSFPLPTSPIITLNIVLDIIIFAIYSLIMTIKPVLVIVFVLLVIATFIVSVLYFSKRQSTIINYQLSINNSSIRVPEPNETDAGETAVPLAAYSTIANSQSKVRSFVLTIENGTFNIKKIAVYENDVISLKVNAVDKEYTVAVPAFGIRQSIQTKETKLVEFQATPAGTFPFYCENCANTGKSQGEIVIVGRN